MEGGIMLAQNQRPLFLKIYYECENCGGKSDYTIKLVPNSNMDIETQRSKMLVSGQFGAKKCPHCGYYQSWMAASVRGKNGLWAIAALFVVYIVTVIVLFANDSSGEAFLLPFCMMSVLIVPTSLLVFVIVSRFSPVGKNKKFGPVVRTNDPIVRTVGSESGMGHVCDLCAASTSEEEGAIFSAEQFRRLVDNGLAPEESTIANMAIAANVVRGLAGDFAGMSDPRQGRRALESWKGMVRTNITDWLLCPDCAKRAESFKSIRNVGRDPSEANDVECPHCGMRNPPNAFFCKGCSTKL
jgi:predicted RNA-binding Zn-ribbon protein involved in translation (DUF1610 family)